MAEVGIRSIRSKSGFFSSLSILSDQSPTLISALPYFFCECSFLEPPPLFGLISDDVSTATKGIVFPLSARAENNSLLLPRSYSLIFLKKNLIPGLKCTPFS